jgi:hypothetical protein
MFCYSIIPRSLPTSTPSDLAGNNNHPKALKISVARPLAEINGFAILPTMLYGDRSDDIRENAEKSLRVAASLFPEETWVYKEPNIYVAKSRLSEEKKEKDKWEREMAQVRIVTGRGSVACFLPEQEKKGEFGKRSPDLVLDGTIVEMKTVSGTRKTLGTQFKYGYKQGNDLVKSRTGVKDHSVFIWLFSNITVESVKAKIAGELKERPDSGNFICFFEKTGELHQWTYEELRALVRKE